jgi:hypothetical protein
VHLPDAGLPAPDISERTVKNTCAPVREAGLSPPKPSSRHAPAIRLGKFYLSARSIDHAPASSSLWHSVHSP